MKSNLLTLVSVTVFSVISNNVIADNNSSEKSISSFGYYELLGMCGSYESVGNTSLFESIEEYENYYPRIGQMLAEIEAIPAISSSTKNYARSVFSEAKEKKVLIYSTSSDISFFKQRNINYITSTQDIANRSGSEFEASISQLQKETNYISEQAVTDVESKLSSSSTRSSKYDITDSNIHSICITWWESGMPFLLTPEERLATFSRSYSKEGYKVNQATKNAYQAHSYNKRDVEIGGYDAGINVYDNVNIAYDSYDESFDQYADSAKNLKGIENSGWENFLENSVTNGGNAISYESKQINVIIDDSYNDRETAYDSSKDEQIDYTSNNNSSSDVNSVSTSNQVVSDDSKWWESDTNDTSVQASEYSDYGIGYITNSISSSSTQSNTTSSSYSSGSDSDQDNSDEEMQESKWWLR